MNNNILQLYTKFVWLGNAIKKGRPIQLCGGAPGPAVTPQFAGLANESGPDSLLHIINCINVSDARRYRNSS